MTHDESNYYLDIYGYDEDSYDDNAGVSLGNAQNTSPLTSSGSGSSVSPVWLNFLNTALTTAGTAYNATVTADANLRNQTRNTQRAAKNSSLLVYLAIGGAVLLGAVLLLRRK